MVGFSTGLGCGCCGNGPDTPCTENYTQTSGRSLYANVNEQWPSRSGVDSRWVPQDSTRFATWQNSYFEWGGNWRFSEFALNDRSLLSIATANMVLDFSQSGQTIFNIETLTGAWGQWFHTKAVPENGGFNTPINAQSICSMVLNGLFSVTTRPGFANNSLPYNDPTKFYVAWIAGPYSGTVQLGTTNPNDFDTVAVYTFDSLQSVSSGVYKLNYNFTITANGVEVVNRDTFAHVRGESGSSGGAISACSSMSLSASIYADGQRWAQNQFRMIPLPSELFRSYCDYFTSTVVWRT